MWGRKCKSGVGGVVALRKKGTGDMRQWKYSSREEVKLDIEIEDVCLSCFIPETFNGEL